MFSNKTACVALLLLFLLTGCEQSNDNTDCQYKIERAILIDRKIVFYQSVAYCQQFEVPFRYANIHITVKTVAPPTDGWDYYVIPIDEFSDDERRDSENGLQGKGLFTTYKREFQHFPAFHGTGTGFVKHARLKKGRYVSYIRSHHTYLPFLKRAVVSVKIVAVGL